MQVQVHWQSLVLLRQFLRLLQVQVQLQVHWQSLVLMLRRLPLLLLLRGAGPPAPVLSQQGNWQSLAWQSLAPR